MSQEQKQLLSERLLTAEQGVLGSMLIDEETVGRMLMAVSEDDFQVPENRSIFRAMKELYGQGRACDPILVNEHLGGAYGKLMASLMEITPTAANAGEYARVLRETSRLWRLQWLGNQLANAEDLDVCRELADQANLLLCERSGVRRMDMTQGWKNFFLRHDPTERKEPVRWGLSRLDEALHVGEGDMVVIGGYASAGKTAFALQLAFQLAKQKRVGFFSYETSADKLHDRMVACQALASYGKITSDKLEKKDFEQVYELRKQLTGPSLELLETSGMTVSGIGSYAMARHYDVIVVDYLQKIPAAGRGRQLSDFERVSQVSNDLQQLGRRTGKIIVALSQLSRPDGDGKAPTMSSLRQSGQIEQDADVVLLLYKEYPKEAFSRRCLDIAKNKDGVAGIGLLLDFDGDNQRFSQSRAQPLPEKKQEAPAQQSIFRPVSENGPTPFDGQK
ncbi:MAG: AAA family ATPase [Oscillibacter sp.]|nr:AAA family ATPase [Oscillibacter sp.]